MINLKKYIRTVPDFPKPGIQFRDITSLIESPEAFEETINCFVDKVVGVKATKIVGIDSRGFIFGAPISYELDIPLILARKPGKLPCDTFKRDYELEYGSTSLEIQKASNIKAEDRVIIIDDLIATGGTIHACADLVHKEFNVPKANILLLAVIDLPDLKGSNLIRDNDYCVDTLIEFHDGESDLESRYDGWEGDLINQ